ncbi:uncharacterized protein TNIN_245822 [Trichonephila inaurata madagascariensis]|uniref:Astakine n=1 Tax=Trichonephila inaurata madagascariensis TaxID=2747483 RepID=A0A8X6XPN7_9ARAC|nr:uncharacterized protein TNIN_245822 [Trichonephila inaurata madagascariensis]
MKTFIFFACVLFVSVISISMAKECTSPKDCEPGECCVLGMQRYSTPNCRSLGKSDDVCLVNNTAEDKLLGYPDGSLRQYYDIYRLFCPCEDNLRCSNAKCVPA